MLEFKGTKGNWSVRGSEYPIIQSKSDESESCIRVYQDIAVVNSVFRKKEEYTANANLIAAAPELLTFIQKYYRFLNLEDQDKAEELIKKATKYL